MRNLNLYFLIGIILDFGNKIKSRKIQNLHRQINKCKDCGVPQKMPLNLQKNNKPLSTAKLISYFQIRLAAESSKFKWK